MAVGLNLWLIPAYGLKGAAIASFSAYFIYNTLKIYYVKSKFKISPFTEETLKVSALLLFVGVLFYYFQFSFHPIFNILLKSALISAMYIGILYRFKISEDVYGVLSRFLKNKK